MNTGVSNFNRCVLLCITAIGLTFCSHFETNDKTVSRTVVPFSFIIGPQDVLEIQVWKEPELSRQVLVRPDGKMSFPLVNDVQAEGLTTLELKALLTEALKNFIENPEVTVALLELNSKNFYIIGEVSNPGTYSLIPDMTVLQAISVAGGLGEWAEKDGILIIRTSNATEEIINFDYEEVIAGNNLEQNILLMPNDTIIVP